jgi:hypothetical protein
VSFPLIFLRCHGDDAEYWRELDFSLRSKPRAEECKSILLKQQSRISGLTLVFYWLQVAQYCVMRSDLSFVIILSLLSLAVRANPQTIVHSFDGDQGAGLAACQSNTECGRQPEMNVAANGRQVVQVTRQKVLIYNYDGKLLRATPLTDFVRSAGLDPMSRQGTGPIEPHVVYDEFLERWIITLTCRNDCLLVSASADPAGKWGGVYLSCLLNGPCLERNPTLKIGYDKYGVYTCGAHRGDDNPHTIRGYANDCFAVPAAEVTAIAGGVAPTHINRAHNLPLDTIPAIDQNPQKPPAAPTFFVAKSCDYEMFWMDLDCSDAARCKVSQTAKISGADFNPEFASIGVDDHGNLGIVAASSNAQSNLSVLIWTHRVSGAPDSFKGPTTIIAGTKPYTCQGDKVVVPIGNSVGILTMRDPLDASRLWTTQQWSNDSRPCVWNTRIIQYQIETAPSRRKK